MKIKQIKLWLNFLLSMALCILLFSACDIGSNSTDKEASNQTSTIKFQLEFLQPSDNVLKAQIEQAISEPDICNDYLIDTIGVQVYLTQDDTEVASAQSNCADHSLTVKDVPAAESLCVVIKGYVREKTIWQGQMNNIVAEAGQNTDIGIIEMQYIGVDNAGPEIVSIFPPKRSTDVDIAASIAVVFNEALAPSSISDQAITILSDDVPVLGRVVYDLGSCSIRFMPTEAFEKDTIYIATLHSKGDGNNPITDTAGRAFADDVSWQFTTRGMDDTALPHVIATSPADGATAVDQQTTISVLFSEPMAPDSLTDNVFQISSDQGAVSGFVAYDNQTRTLTLTPNAALEPATLYTAVISTEAKDTAQNALAALYTWQFWTRGPLFNLVVTKTGSGSGRIVATPAYIDCGDTCQARLSAGIQITLEAIADDGSGFTGWSEEFCKGETVPCTFTITKDTSMAAVFSVNTYTINASVDLENGTWRKNFSHFYFMFYPNRSQSWAGTIRGSLINKEMIIYIQYVI